MENRQPVPALKAPTSLHVEVNEPQVAVSVNSVEKEYQRQGSPGKFLALGPVSFSIKQGEFFTVVGPSGCGKSTLFDLIAGLATPTNGTVVFNGTIINGKVPDGIGAIFQEDASFPWLTVEDNIAFGLRCKSIDEVEVRNRVEYALDFMGLQDFRKAYPKHLSGGMKQRVCIARTLVERPKMILMDEPFAALDQQTRLLMGDELLRIWRETGATIFFITHSLDEAAMLSSRVGVMSARPGRFIDFVETGWPDSHNSEIISSAAFGEITSRLWKLLRNETKRSLTDKMGRPV